MEQLLNFCVHKPGQKDYKRIEQRVFDVIAEAVKQEKHLLEVGSLALKWSYDDGFAVVVLNQDGEPVGYTRLALLMGENEEGRMWLELGSTWVRDDYRNRGINKDMYRALLPNFVQHNVLATTTNVASIAIGEELGFVPVERKKLPERTWRTSCTCPKEKTRASDSTNMDCALAHGEPQKLQGVTACWFRVTPETAQRLNLDSCVA